MQGRWCFSEQSFHWCKYLVLFTTPTFTKMFHLIFVVSDINGATFAAKLGTSCLLMDHTHSSTDLNNYFVFVGIDE